MTPAERVAEIEKGAHLIPAYMLGGIRRYLLNRVPPGHFLTAVLSNDLFGAFTRADEENAAAMLGWVRFLYRHAPANAYGSPEKVRAWLAGEALAGEGTAPSAQTVDAP